MASKAMELFERMNLEQKLRDRRFRMITAGSLAVLLIMISIVIRPAFTMEKVLTCTQEEHTHSDSCYVMEDIHISERLGCDVKIHSHNEKCVDENGNVTCTKADYIRHSHNEYCYNGSGTLVCAITENSGDKHTHTDACKGEDDVIVCGLLEVTGHNHNGSCVDSSLPIQKQVLACTQAEHSHVDGCYTVTQKGEEPAVSSSDESADQEEKISDSDNDTSENATPNDETSGTDVSTEEPKPIISGSDEENESAGTSESVSESDDVQNQPDTDMLSSDTNMSLMLPVLMMSTAPQAQSEDMKELELDVTTRFTVPGYTTDATHTFTPPYSHDYTVKYTYSSGWSNIRILDSYGNQIRNDRTTSTITVPLIGGETYTFSLYNDYSSEKTATITVSHNPDSGHVYEGDKCPCGAEAPELSGTCDTNLTWTYKDNVLTISGTGDMSNFSSGNAPWNSIKDSIKTIVIEDGVKSIGQNAFRGCTALKSVSIPDSVTAIRSSAFYDCKALESITIPDSVTYLESNLFRNCTSLKNVDIGSGVKSIPQYMFYGCKSLESVTIPDTVTSMSTGVFYDCTALKDVTLSDKLTSIPDSTFYNCKSLESIDELIDGAVATIGSSAFRGCTSIKDLEIPGNVAKINSYAFYGCTSLESAVIPNTVTYLGSGVFYNCTSLKDVTLSENLTNIPSETFYNCKSLESIDELIDGNVTTIGSNAFYGCTSLTSVVVPDNVKTVNSYAFRNCTSIESAVIPDSVTSMGSGIFHSCTSLKDVTLSEKIKSIPSETFYGCTSLDSIDDLIDGEVTSIGNSAFYGCTSLDSIEIPEKVTSIGQSAFYNCTSLESIDIPDNVTSIGQSAFRGCTALTDVTLSENITSIPNEAFYGCTSLDSIEIPDRVTSIGSSAFSSCTSLESVEVPDSVISLGTSVFSSCTSLKEATLSENITKVPDNTFYGCTSLESLDVPDGVTSIGSRAFYNCTSLDSADISENVTNIGYQAFYNCDGLTGELRIAGDIEKIGYEAFEDCDNVKSVVVDGDVNTVERYVFSSMNNLESVTINGDIGTLGYRAFQSNSKMKELIINGDVDKIDYSVCQSLSSLEKVIMNGDVKTINYNAFYNCDNLTDVKLSDAIENIGYDAFRDCDALEKVTLPKALNTLGTNVFYSCDLLSEITLDSENLETVPANVFTDCTELEKLIVTNNVDVVTEQFINSLSGVGTALDNVVFQGENYITIEKDMGKGNTIKAGKYYVDAQGALYSFDSEKGTATLYRAPAGLTEYTIPETIPSENGGTYSVTGVEANALKGASDLESLVFAAPEKITYLPSGACANCPTLKSVNGKTTVAEAYDLFTNENITKYDYVFFNTGLLDNGQKTDEELFINGENDDNIPLIRIITGKNEGTNNEEFKNTYTYYTGETSTLNIAISNANAGDYDSVRVYIAFDEDGGQMSWPLGTHSVQTENGKTYNLKIAQSDAKNVYYIECDRIDVGDTVSANLTIGYPSPNTGGGKVRIWPVVLGNGERDDIADGVIAGEKYNEVEWVTKADDFSLRKSHTNIAYRYTGLCVASKGEDDNVYLYNVAYTISKSRIGNTLLGIGKDHMKSVDFVDVLRLPEGMYWREDIVDAVRNGSYTVSASGTYLYVYAVVDGVNMKICEITTSSQTAEYINKSLRLEVTGDEDIAIYWSYRNNSVDSTEMNNITATIRFVNGKTVSHSEYGYTYTDYQSYICIDKNHLEEKLTLHNDVDTIQHFCYSVDQTDHAEVERIIDAGKADFVPTKRCTYYSSNWGDRFEYAVGISNPYAHDYPGIFKMSDPLADEYYIRPENMQRMFDEAVEAKDRIKSLTITIDKATLCNDTAAAYTPGATVVGTDGSTHTLVQNNTGIGTNYNGCEGSDPGEYTTDATLVIKCTTEDGKQVLTYNGVSYDASNIATILEALGYVVTRNAQYTVDWELADNFILESGETYERNIYAHIKDTFMLISDDTPINAPYNSISIPQNRLYVKYMLDGNETEKSARYDSHTPNRDFYLNKDYAINGVANADVAEVGDIIDYTLTVQHRGYSNSYSILPLTDHMIGGQVMLVPAEGNAHLAETYGLTTVDVNGESYYPINKVGTYKSVKVDGRIADSITVTQMSGGGFDTLIRWYMTDIVNYTTKYIGYKAMVDPAVTGVTAMQFSLDNETWLNDHQSHRLYDTIGNDGYSITGTQIAFSKYIVTDKGATPDEDALAIYSRFDEGQPTTYRLSLTNLSDEGVVNINGKYIYDSLPKTRHEVYKWSKDNIRMTFVPAKEGDFSFTFEGGSIDSAWYIDSTPPQWTGVGEDEDQQYIRWSDDFTIHLKGTVYIYVTIDMPEGAEWIDNAIKYRETVLENSFYVYESKATVTHDLAIIAEAYLQKGVKNTGVNMYSSNITEHTYEDARLHYINTGSKKEYVNYYISLYNGGHTRLYLNPIQDYLPKGFTYYSNKSPSTSYSTWLTLYDSQGNKLSPVWKSANVSAASSGRNITFTLSNTSTSHNLNYDPYYDKYYLAPNEAVIIVYYANVGKKGTTDEIATNYAAMPYFDYLGQGVEKTDVSMVSSNSYNQILNDGTCNVTDTGYAGSIGMTGGSVGTQWLESHVSLTPGAIVPGITKWVDKITRTNGEVSTSKETAGSEDTVTWTVKQTNTGSDNISHYTFTDVMNGDYGFIGDVLFGRSFEKYNGYNYGSYSATKLFTIIRDEEDLDNITIEYYTGSSLNTATVDLVRGGDAVPIKLFLNANSGSYYTNYGTANISVRIYVDENNNEVLVIEMISDILDIPAYGSVNFKLSTKNFGTWENKVYYNNAYLTPLDQGYDSDMVSQGNHLLFGDAQMPTVRNAAQITAAYGYVTTSEKRIREIGNETNCASSKDEKNWIFLDEHKDTFRYTNIVNNVTGKPLSKFIMIDNLPQIGDHETFAATEPRYSAFKVELTSSPNFEVYMLVEGNKTTLTADQYEIMFSDRTEFAGKDWDDSSDTGWYTSPKNSTRSFRISIYDDTGLVIPDQAAICVEYNGKIIMADDYANDEVTTDPVEGTIAWNSFGYHYKVLGERLSLEAAPLKVGICVKYIPIIQKKLIYPDGDEFIASEDESFRYLIYTGNALSNLSDKTEAQIGELLKKNNRKAILVTLDVKAGQSASEALELSDVRAVQYDSTDGTWKDAGEWRFIDGDSYNVIELVDKDSIFGFKSIESSPTNGYNFTFDGMKLLKIKAVNVRKSWNVRINKVDAAESKPLAGAYFGIYTLIEREAISDAEYEALDLKKKPAKLINYDGKMWMLSKVRESDASGTALFDGLVEDSYIVTELQAPGGYKLEKDIYKFNLTDCDETFNISKKVVNDADYELPKTGTKEASNMMLWGNVLMLIAFAILAVKKNFLKQEQN